MSLINLESLTSFRLVHLEEEHLFEVLLRPPPHALLPPVGSALDHKDAFGAGAVRRARTSPPPSRGPPAQDPGP